MHNDENSAPVNNEVTISLVNALNELKTGKSCEENLTDYECYRQGINYYRNIHPDRFYKRMGGKNYQTLTNDEIKTALQKIRGSFELSRHYFAKLLNEFPQSQWAEDAALKIKLLDKLEKSYGDITVEGEKISSFDTFMNQMGLRRM